MPNASFWSEAGQTWESREDTQGKVACRSIGQFSVRICREVHGATVNSRGKNMSVGPTN